MEKHAAYGNCAMTSGLSVLRLNLTPRSVVSRALGKGGAESTPASRGLGIGGGKRKRTMMESSDVIESEQSELKTHKSTKGEIEIAEADPEGKFVRLVNKSNKVGFWSNFS